MTLPVAVSTGMGVQSTAILRLVELGRLPRPDVWVFADTGDEPASVYRMVEWCRPRIAALGSELVTVRHESSRSLSLEYLEGQIDGGHPPQPPLFIPDPARPGKYMPMRRQCTERFKIRPIKRFLRERFSIRRGKGPQVVQWLGISTDEAHRMKPAGAGWYSVAWPLIDLGLSRKDCVALLAEAGITAPRSACSYCPFHSNAEWRRLRSEEPEAFQEAVAFEATLHLMHDAGYPIGGQIERPFLHRSGVPLADVNFGSDDVPGWGNECSGVCGV